MTSERQRPLSAKSRRAGPPVSALPWCSGCSKYQLRGKNLTAVRQTETWRPVSNVSSAKPSSPKPLVPLVQPLRVRRWDSRSARSVASQVALSHLAETRLAELVINHREECRHERNQFTGSWGSRCKLAGLFVGKMRSWIARAS